MKTNHSMLKDLLDQYHPETRGFYKRKRNRDDYRYSLFKTHERFAA